MTSLVRTSILRGAKFPASEIQKIADLASIPESQLEHFERCVRGIVSNSWMKEGRDVPNKCSEELRRLDQAARQLAEALNRLGKDDQQWLGQIFDWQAPWVSEVYSKLPGFLDQAASALGQVTGRSTAVQDGIAKKGRGRPSGGAGHAALHKITYDLLLGVSAAGGNLTINKNNENDCLRTVLNILRDYLPYGVIPEILPSPTLQNIRSKFKRQNH
jgi:hypothetical protein